jgi:RHS repeat-associated protein
MSFGRCLLATICLLVASAGTAAETPADKFKKIMPAINFLLLGGETVEIYNVYADHLNTPRLITNQANQPVWRYDNNDPFGANFPDENPSSLGTFEYALRDDGTYFDTETGLVYNVNRYRDLNSGRFMQGDPLGLTGGDLSLYALRKNNPLSFTDPRGLQQFPIPTTGTSSVQQVGATVAMPMLPAPPGSTAQVIGAAGDFWRNYMDMRNANTIGGDLYFHCKANCEAARRGPSGHDTACRISDAREWVDQHIFRDPAIASQVDQMANAYGRGWGWSTGLPCDVACMPYRPIGLPWQY